MRQRGCFGPVLESFDRPAMGVGISERIRGPTVPRGRQGGGDVLIERRFLHGFRIYKGAKIMDFFISN